jgi:hypothetical protein
MIMNTVDKPIDEMDVFDSMRALLRDGIDLDDRSAVERVLINPYAYDERTSARFVDWCVKAARFNKAEGRFMDRHRHPALVDAGIIPPEHDQGDEHDLDFDRIDAIPIEQGSYDNGRQLVEIWCRTHECFEWQWVTFERIPEHKRPRPRPDLRLVDSKPDDCA